MLQVPVEHSRGQLMMLDPAIMDAGGMPLQRQSKSWRKFQRKAMVHRRFAGFSSLSGSMATSFNWNAQVNLTGSAYNPSTNASAINKRQQFGTSVGTNTQSGGADECFSFQQGVTAGASVTVDLIAMTDLLQRASSTIARIKGYQIRVLSAGDDATISPAPNASSIGVVTNIGPATPSPLDFGNNGSGLTIACTVTGNVIDGGTIGAAGTGYPKSSAFLVSPVQTGGGGAVFGVLTNSSGVPTSVVFVFGGVATYTAATLPTVVVGQYPILTGGTHVYFDPSATGFCLVSATQKQIKLINTDQSNAVTFEIDVFAAST
jgi:hypothetical protein